MGQMFAREAAPDIAEARAESISIGETVTIPVEAFSHALPMLEQNSLDGDEDKRGFAEGIRLTVDADIQLISP